MFDSLKTLVESNPWAAMGVFVIGVVVGRFVL